MLALQELASQNQGIPSEPSMAAAEHSGVLGNPFAQCFGEDRLVHLEAELPDRVSGPGVSARLAALKRTRFTPSGNPERVARSLAALNQEVGIHIPLKELKEIIELVDLEDQYEI